MKALEMVHEVDPREELLKRLGDLSQFEIMGNQVLIAVYERPEKTKGGIVLPETHRAEDAHQGKAGLVVKLGPSAFVSDHNYDFKGQSVREGDWVAIFVADGKRIVLRKQLCRIVDDHHIRMKIPTPDSVY